jgi:hypothetical protein
MAYLPAIKKRVSLARRIEKHIHEKRKSKSDADWFRRAAKDMDIDVDEVWGQPAFVARVWFADKAVGVVTVRGVGWPLWTQSP